VLENDGIPLYLVTVRYDDGERDRWTFVDEGERDAFFSDLLIKTADECDDDSPDIADIKNMLASNRLEEAMHTMDLYLGNFYRRPNVKSHTYANNITRLRRACAEKNQD